jgi:uncharacterized protein (DUF58 family)
MRRRQGPDALPVAVHRRRLYILPTRAGSAFALLLFFMLIAGLNYGNGLALFLTFLFAGFALVAMHRCHRNLLDVALTAVTPVSGFADESVQVLCTLANPSSTARWHIEVGALEAEPASASPAANSTASARLILAAEQRGRLHVDRIELATSFPFGLFRAWTWVHLPTEIIVYPRPRGALPMPSGTGPLHGRRLRARGGAEEWMGLRPFRDGDSPRQVAWKAYARGAPLLVKEYGASESDLKVFDFESLPSLDTETRLEQLSRWVVDAEALGERYGVRLGPRLISPDRGTEHRHRCLSELATHGLPARETESAS